MSEQEMMSVTKTGMIAKVRADNSIRAVTNPRGALYSTKIAVAKTTNIGRVIVMKFVLIFG